MDKNRLPNIIDLEASGFGKKSYPIEVGFVLSNGDSYCSLIKPVDGWNNWDKSAEQVHGINRDILLKAGKPVSEIALSMNNKLSGEIVYSDAWGNDSSWLGLLFDEANIPMCFKMDSIRSILSEEQAANWHETKEKVIKSTVLKRHRASSDAAILQKTFSLIIAKSKKII